jgi:hypothetical protein
VIASSLIVEDVERRQANVGEFFFMQHHLLTGRFPIHAANCGGGVGR